MLAVRIAQTDPDRQAARSAWLHAHQTHLRSGLVEVLQSGPLLDGDDPYGALLVASVAHLSDLKHFSDLDPFVVHGVYRTVTILRWSRTIG